MTILVFPDGSAFQASAVCGITWDKARGSGEHRSPACIRVYAKRPALLSLGHEHVEQVHYMPMESDEAAQEACKKLTAAWAGLPMPTKPPLKVVS